MKRLFCVIICLILCLSLCGCDIKEFGAASEVWSSLQSQINQLTVDSEVIVEIEVEEYYVWSPEFDACYNALNSKQKKIYEVLFAAAEQMPDGFIKVCEEYDGVMADIHLAYTAMLNDNTEIFWMPNTYLVGKTNKENNRITIAFNYSKGNNNVSYPVNKEKRDSMRKELDIRVEEILSTASHTKNQYEIEKIFNDYICANTEYNTNAEFASTSYGCLVLNQALCEGYARAFKLLCNKAGIECDLVLGFSQGEGHMWNIVNIDGIHNYVDVTWNDTSEEMIYMYFNITEEQLLFDHSFSPLFKRMNDDEICSGKSFNFIERDCTYSGNTYFAKNNLVLDYGYTEKAAEILNENAREGILCTAFLIDNDELLKELETDANSVLNKIQYKTAEVKIKQYIFERDVLLLFCEVAD